MQFCIYIPLRTEIEPKHMQAALIDSRTVSYCVCFFSVCNYGFHFGAVKKSFFFLYVIDLFSKC